MIEYMFDIKSWLMPHLYTLQNHSYPHIFRFTRDGSGEVVMHYKDWNKSPWEPSDNGIRLFKVNLKCAISNSYISLLSYCNNNTCIHIQTYPTGYPNLLAPSLERLDYNKLCSHAKQYRQKCGISEAAQKWWDVFLLDIKANSSHVFHSVVPEWPLQAIIDVLDRENDSERQTQNEVRILLCTYNIAGTSPGKI